MTEPDKQNPRDDESAWQVRGQLLLDRLRHQLAHLDALPQLTILGLISGLAAAFIIIAFRLAIDYPLSELLEDNSDDFESLPRFWHFALPVLGALVLALCISVFPRAARQVSVGHVLERLHNHQGKLPAINILVQFVGGVVALLTGQSVGREGPAVHLGAGAASQLSQWLHLPNNCLRTLIGCGVAAAIAASFNTPMAGVIFSMEVILMEYTIAGFVPVMLASVAGATIAQLVFGSQPAFTIIPLQLTNLWELPIIAFSGLLVAIFAATFVQLQLLMHQQQSRHLVLRFLTAGLVTGTLALWFPQILGIGYDTLELAMSGQLSFYLLGAILLAKLVATAVSGGLGIPGGMIGPTLLIGAMLGGCIGTIASVITPESGANPAFYVLLGMGAMMAAVINAPLTALITVFELTHNPNTIFPTMLIIVVSVIATRQLFNCQGIFIDVLTSNGVTIKGGPLRQALNRVGVRSVMDTDFLHSSNKTTLGDLRKQLKEQPRWLVVDQPESEAYLVAAADVFSYLEERTETDDHQLEILELPGRKWQLKAIHQQASLLEAQEVFNELKSDALYVERRTSILLSPVIGIITQEHIDNFYQTRDL